MKEAKAGIIPYYIKNDITYMLFMIPSDPKFGGSNWQIAKGTIDPGETESTAAVREGSEELGLKTSNIKKFWKVETNYLMHLYACEIIDPKDFDQPHFETGKTGWLTIKQFNQLGRPIHKSLVSNFYRKL